MTTEQPLLIRADASAEIGAGHVMRCIALAQAWAERGGRPVFLMHRPGDALVWRIREEGFGYEPLSADPAANADAEETQQVARRIGAAWCVVDGYAFGQGYLNRLSRSVRVLRIDDYQSEAEPAAACTLNPNYDPALLTAAGDGFFSGAAYTLLRRPYSRLREVPRTYRLEPREVLLTFGGSDPSGLTLKSIDALLALEGTNLHLSVVVGALNPRVSEVEAACSGRGAAVEGSVTFAASDAEMAALMKRADLCLIAAGNTLWEAMSAGLPILSYAYTPYQQALLRHLDTEGCVRYLGAVDAFDAARLQSEVLGLLAAAPERARLGTAARRLIDGRGADRVVDRLLNSPALTAPVSQTVRSSQL